MADHGPLCPGRLLHKRSGAASLFPVRGGSTEARLAKFAGFRVLGVLFAFWFLAGDMGVKFRCNPAENIQGKPSPRKATLLGMPK